MVAWGCVSHGPDLRCSLQHHFLVNCFNILTLNIDKEDVYPRPGSSEYPVTRVVAVAHVCDDLGEYQGTAAPGTAGWRNTGCESYPCRLTSKTNVIKKYLFVQIKKKIKSCLKMILNTKNSNLSLKQMLFCFYPFRNQGSWIIGICSTSTYRYIVLKPILLVFRGLIF